MEILYLGGLKQTVYFDTGRLQGYPLCEIDFFHFLIGFSIRDWSIEMWEVLPQKLVTPKNWLPPKIDLKKMATPKKIVTPKNWSKKNWLPPKKCYPQKNKKKWLPQKCWRTLLRGGLLLNFGKMAYFIAYGFVNAIHTLSGSRVSIYIYKPLLRMLCWLGFRASFCIAQLSLFSFKKYYRRTVTAK